jgi:hypothetical protein
MGLNDIELTPAVLNELYGKTVFSLEKINDGLIAEPASAKEKPAEKKQVQQPPYLGDNKRNVLVLVSHTAHTFLPDEEMKKLIEILGACKLGLADVALVNAAQHAFDMKETKKQFRPKVVLAFGLDPAVLDIPFRVPLFQAQGHAGMQYLLSVSLGELLHDQNLKKDLWAGLKKVFSI